MSNGDLRSLRGARLEFKIAGKCLDPLRFGFFRVVRIGFWNRMTRISGDVDKLPLGGHSKGRTVSRASPLRGQAIQVDGGAPRQNSITSQRARSQIQSRIWNLDDEGRSENQRNLDGFARTRGEKFGKIEVSRLAGPQNLQLDGVPVVAETQGAVIEFEDSFPALKIQNRLCGSRRFLGILNMQCRHRNQAMSV